MDKQIVISVLVALAIAATLTFVGLLSLPLAEPLVWAMLIGISTYPHYQRLVRMFPRHQGVAAGLMVLIITLCIILPMAALIFAIARNATELYHQSQDFIQQMGSTGTSVLSKIPYANRIVELADRFGIDITGHASQIAGTASDFLVTAASGAVKNVAHFALTLAMAIFILFFIYRDGREIVQATVRRFFSDQERARHYVTQIGETTTAVMIGTILTSMAQGFLSAIGYYWAGVPAFILFGCITAVAALVPVVGIAIIWVPLVGFLAITGAYLKAGLLAAWCSIFVGLSDNAIRPLAMGTKGQIPVMAVVFGAVGGAEVLGLIGLIVGPIIFALLAVVWRDLTGRPAGVEG